MSKIKGDEPAFPHVAVDGHPDYRRGMDQRTWLTGMALAHCILSPSNSPETYRAVAEAAVRLADATIAALNAEPGHDR